jgi:flagellar hook-associated protein 1 FlgK
MSGLYKIGSGLNAAQSGLNVTSHNTANADTKGYSRQRIVQSDSFYSPIGSNGSGKLQVGMGVEIDSLEQVRNNFLDIAYRQEASRAQYYTTRENAVSEVVNVLGEINGESISAQISDLWNSIDTLSNHPEGMETRKVFLQTAVSFVTKANNIHDKIEKYQYNLDTQVKNAVTKINEISSQIADYNSKITKYEAPGDHANDFRDQRNLLLDELSTYGELNVSEDTTGQVNVLFEGHTIVQKDFNNTIGLQYIKGTDGQSFVQPIWSTVADEILGEDAQTVPVYTKAKLQTISKDAKTDTGILKGLMTSRGDVSANYKTSDADIAGFIIPKVEKELDILVNKIATMLNTMVTSNTASSGKPAYDLYGNNTNNEPIFTAKDGTSNLTLGNLQVNQVLLDDYNKLALSVSGDKGDNTLVENILAEWKKSDGAFSPKCTDVGYSQNFETYYAEFVGRLGKTGQEANNMVTSQNTLLNDIDNKRLSVSGVSIDEEMSNMIIYQHAYNAAAKVYNVIDSMLEAVINM